MTDEIKELEAQHAELWKQLGSTFNAEDRKEIRHEIRILDKQIEELHLQELRKELIPDEYPDELKDFIIKKAWERGHSGGYSEVRNEILELVDDIQVIQEILNKQQTA